MRVEDGNLFVRAELIAALRGKATRSLTTDDIIQLTRADP
jgi:hypothetical protein